MESIKFKSIKLKCYVKVVNDALRNIILKVCLNNVISILEINTELREDIALLRISVSSKSYHT